MYRVYAPFLIQLTEEARASLPISPAEAAQIVFRAVAAAGKGFDIAYLPVEMKGVNFAASSRVTTRGTVVIELDYAQPGLTPRLITGETYRKAIKLSSSRGKTLYRRVQA
jgi:hypothetical protein